MRLHFKERPVNYQAYCFPYQVYAAKEPGDSLASIYDQGFLPVSNDLHEGRELFYLARSLRLDLSTCQYDKKRRYLQRRGADAGLTSERVTLVELGKRHPDWKAQAVQWVEGRFDPPYMTLERLDFITGQSYLKNAVIIHAQSELVGLALIPEGDPVAHYWFALYNPFWEPSLSLGKWILAECAEVYKKLAYRHLYLGTCYTQTAAYKFQGMTQGVEYFDGTDWSSDKDTLLKKLEADSAGKGTDI